MDTYAIVTEKIINLLEQGIVPWRRPWSATGLPRNLVSKKPYRGVNLFLLSATKYVLALTHRSAELVRLLHGQAEGFYSLLTDRITLAPARAFRQHRRNLCLPFP
jgi:antirestriction protein ArdC